LDWQELLGSIEKVVNATPLNEMAIGCRISGSNDTTHESAEWEAMFGRDEDDLGSFVSETIDQELGGKLYDGLWRFCIDFHFHTNFLSEGRKKQTPNSTRFLIQQPKNDLCQISDDISMN
jgi:hypothetical protein